MACELTRTVGGRVQHQGQVDPTESGEFCSTSAFAKSFELQRLPFVSRSWFQDVSNNVVKSNDKPCPAA